MIAIDPNAIRETFARGDAYEFLVRSDLQLGVLEDALTKLRAAGVEAAGYDIRPAPRGCIIAIRESGECMVEADLMHMDLRLLMVGEGIDHVLDDEDEIDDAQPIEVVSTQAPLGELKSASGRHGSTAERVFSWVEAAVPRRYADEELGDALEEIHQRVAEGCSPWWVRVKIVTTIFWILVHFAVEEYARFTRALRR